MDLSRAIQKARLDKKITQKDLAALICEKPQIIGEYENGKIKIRVVKRFYFFLLKSRIYFSFLFLIFFLKVKLFQIQQ